MASVEENKRYWDGEYDWDGRGDEWSAAWNGPSMQWFGTLLPRIHSYVPTDSILEIASGYGRWTQYLKDLCKSLTVVDISEKCLEASKRRFARCSHIRYYMNDGKSLDMIPDSSIDFVFSFDSLVHADETVMHQYISQFPRILKTDGVVVLHHSNLGDYLRVYTRIRRVPRLEALLKKFGILDQDLGWRDERVSAKLVESLAEENGMRCISQEIIPWESIRISVDCITVMVKKDSPVGGPNRVFRNHKFIQEAQYLSNLSRHYRRANSRC